MESGLTRVFVTLAFATQSHGTWLSWFPGYPQAPGQIFSFLPDAVHLVLIFTLLQGTTAVESSNRELVQVCGCLSGTETTYQFVCPLTPETGQQRQFCLFFSIKFEVALDPMGEDSLVWQLTEHETEGKNMMKRGISICSWEVLATDGLLPLTWTESSPANMFICQYIWLGRDPLILGEIDLQKPWVYLK